VTLKKTSDDNAPAATPCYWERRLRA